MTTTLIQTPIIKDMRLTASDLGITSLIVLAHEAVSCSLAYPILGGDGLARAQVLLAEALDLLTLDPVATEDDDQDEDTSRDGDRCTSTCGYCGRCS